MESDCCDNERWLLARGLPAGYEASTCGRLRHGRKLLSGWINRQGYLILAFKANKSRTSIAFHRVIGLTFLGNPPDGKPEINHIDGNKENNHLSNIEWLSHRDNMLHARHVLGRVMPGCVAQEHQGTNSPRAKLTAYEVQEIRVARRNGEGCCQLATRFNVSPATISSLCHGRHYANIQ